MVIPQPGLLKIRTRTYGKEPRTQDDRYEQFSWTLLFGVVITAAVNGTASKFMIHSKTARNYGYEG